MYFNYLHNWKQVMNSKTLKKISIKCNINGVLVYNKVVARLNSDLLILYFCIVQLLEYGFL